ncbi:3'(2'),5'-bisphosphate nucleotidase CysQ [Moellerella wisconsensis]|uniref:3'(2'),5'-bisphosphate nucleotidase CysQ n=2 Tax=Moellerella wisconsensis TaxID=158849 RepID=A0A9Q8Q138_9GAMM|nr:3'(2'),5'-bisphosphate nucleotidase CysQ [Moellerella wisconsensis]KLN97934.1 adenosine-3'(2'),5'-bisphosphate nucleotidase [Moellerella wisconsensis]UNH23984.1 3'(2'),5'-bisphosphate nucleotidase CysQ [Moellerella wisconsensis]UNH27067.1 3'(2'),5'-bisphosphate nucleotidase CysQ [Moellerella wisconsensis]UNH30540.1 3'(2'),5'-bisphosphate nucleotidase CysQ [Moellerella wisconsensis]UNH38701.1 3'(2'),5'-bisphosphate nucleotidase CysQ [Moellerella wisconsensis]
MLEQVCKLAKEAGSVIMDIYHADTPVQVEKKSDDSPVTAADIAAHQIIKAGLSKIDPSIPQLSEEDPPAWEERQHWQRYWLIDPLDGTKEFIKRNGEFTVNIALIDQGAPILGVVYAPAQGILYCGQGRQAWKEEKGHRQLIRVSQATLPLIVVSRSHQDAELQDYLSQMGEHETVAIGSSLKFCLVAEGKAQLYPRFGPTNIWDTAAGHAVAIAAGAKVTDWKGNTLDYSPRESFLNPGFRVSLL